MHLHAYAGLKGGFSGSNIQMYSRKAEPSRPSPLMLVNGGLGTEAESAQGAL